MVSELLNKNAATYDEIRFLDIIINMGKILKFPKDFLWGAGVSAYQVEGGINCDWTEFFDAGRACDHYNRHEQDFDLMEKLNLNAFRFSIEWSRIEPEPGKFNQKEIEHYRKYLESLKRRGIKTMVTLHHFTNPVWLTKIGKKWGLSPLSWASKKSVFYFSRFCERMLKEYSDLVDFWLTINEPLIYSTIGFLEGRWPPQKRNALLCLKAIKNQIAAHKKIYRQFHSTKPDIKIGIAKNNRLVKPFSKSPLDRFSAFAAHYFWNKFFLNRIKNYLDFIGLNYYSCEEIRFPFLHKKKNGKLSDIEWPICPKGIYYVLKDLKKYNLPVYITENGVADKADKLRTDFIKEHLFWIHKAIEQGVDVKGYFHWSLMDNFEWEKGFKPRFGLVEIDYTTMERRIRDSALYYAKICQENHLRV